MFGIDKGVTRIDLERVGEGVTVSMWNGKWSEGSSPASYQFETGSIERILFECEKVGFTVEMMDGSHGRALRGEVIRIDILQIAGKWIGRKFPHGWTAKTRSFPEKELSEDQASAVIRWCKENKWTVREFPGGARAWKYEVRPVRDAYAIQKMRSQVVANFDRGEIDTRRQFDLAFDC